MKTVRVMKFVKKWQKMTQEFETHALQETLKYMQEFMWNDKKQYTILHSAKTHIYNSHLTHQKWYVVKQSFFFFCVFGVLFEFVFFFVLCLLCVVCFISCASFVVFLCFFCFFFVFLFLRCRFMLLHTYFFFFDCFEIRLWLCVFSFTYYTICRYNFFFRIDTKKLWCVCFGTRYRCMPLMQQYSLKARDRCKFPIIFYGC